MCYSNNANDNYYCFGESLWQQQKKFSRKREAILTCLHGTTCHPTAEWVYQQLKPQFPDLSLGTVYRNLAAFKAEGVIDSVGVVNGLERYDGNTIPHAHIVCESCGAVLDAETIELPDKLLAHVQQDTRLRHPPLSDQLHRRLPKCLQKH